MTPDLTADLLATALQKLEAIQANETEVPSKKECRERAEEVAEAALQALAVTAKYLLAKNAEARIAGLGSFHLEEEQIRFIPDADVIQYALLKQRTSDQLQLSLRNAFVASLAAAQQFILLFQLSEADTVTTKMTNDSDLVEDVFGATGPNNFAQTVSMLLRDIAEKLQDAGFTGRYLWQDRDLATRKSLVERAADLSDSPRDLAEQGRDRVRTAVSAIRGQADRFASQAGEETKSG